MSGVALNILEFSLDTNIVEIVTHEVRIGYEGPLLQIISENHSMILQISDELSQNILDDIQMKRIRFINVLSTQYACFSLSAVLKKQNDEFTEGRRIHDLFFSHGSSVNDSISEQYRSLSYQTLDDVIQIIECLDRHITLHKRDLKDAFRKISVSSLDIHLLLFKGKDQIYSELFLSFDLTTSSLLFNLFAEALHGILNYVYNQYVMHYLDDFLLFNC